MGMAYTYFQMPLCPIYIQEGLVLYFYINLDIQVYVKIHEQLLQIHLMKFRSSVPVPKTVAVFKILYAPIFLPDQYSSVE